MNDERIIESETYRLSEAEVGGVLVHFHEEMRNGVEDSEIAEETGIPVTRVRRYRQAHVVNRHQAPIGTSNLPVENPKYQAALDLFGDGSVPEFIVDVESPHLNHRWEPPTYVRRVPLNYDLMCFGLYQLNRFGMRTEQLANAFGILIEDVSDALSLYNSYLDRAGVLCPLCKGALIDPIQQRACVPRCAFKKDKR